MHILLIIVLYKKSINELFYLNNIKQELDVLIYDNSPERQEAPSDIYYYHNPLNVGVSAAYNYGIDLAEKIGKKYVVLLDQDTVFDTEKLSYYKKAALKYGEDYIYAPICKNGDKIYSPFIEDRIGNHCQSKSDFVYKSVYDLKGKSLINSGLMIPLKIIKEVGKFNENIKLDFSDIYFIELYKRKHQFIILLDVYLEHRLSGDEGKNKNKELNRFKYYCNGAREYLKSTENPSRIKKMVLFRMIRLIAKYKSITPIGILIDYYLGDKTV